MFISYAHKDEPFKDDLVKHLRPLQRLGLVEQWNDRRIPAGVEWAPEISKHLDQARLIVLLISVDFVNSDYCYGIELERALVKHAEGTAVVVPVIVRSCLWQHSPFAKLQALPKDARAISTWADRDEAYTSVAESLRQVAETLLKPK